MIDNKHLKIVSIFSFPVKVLDEFGKKTYIKLWCGSLDKPLEYDFIDDSDIHDLNKYINEQTGIYWTYQNYEKIGNPDFIGFAHYRRYFPIDNLKLTENDVVCTFEIQPGSIYQMFSLYHVKSDIDMFLTRFLTDNPKYKDLMIQYLNQNVQATRNMFIMSRENFFDYMDFMKKCIKVVKQMLNEIKFDERDKYQMRGCAFILERMTGFWIYQLPSTINVINQKPITENIDSPYQRI